MDYREPTVRSRELGDGMRRAMKGAGLNGKQTAAKLGWSDSKLSRMLLGARGTSEVDVASFLGVCGVKGKERARLLDLCREQHSRSWFQQYGSRLPKQLRTLVDHEDQALTMAGFESVLIPGLLQTGDYARSIIRRNANLPPDEVDERVIAKLARQQLLSRDKPPHCTFYVHEFAFRLPVGGAAVMSEQLHYLLRMSVRRNVTLRVVPASFGAHAAMAGTFRLMEFPTFKPIVYLDSETSSLFLERPEEIAAYQGILAALADTALNEGQSTELIATLATELYADREDNDERA
ncbi:helix-turn-helix domain-containing protein [Actinokineospora sp.]|uniref:helix-turn-helix domain-containing protein n=1 Tax=Actinokineospora sp. TaxID=1872133 RepID=UPI004037B8C6